jgi:predicted permease
MLNDLRFRLRALFRRKAMESDLDEELRFHFEHEVEKYIHAGMTTDQARRQARLHFGGHEQVKEDCREARGTSLLETALRDILYGLRVHRKNPGFFIIATLTLALGIGASTAVFSLLDTILLKPSPYPNASRIVVPWRQAPINSALRSIDFAWNEAEYVPMSRTARAFENLGAFRKDTFNLTGSANPERLEGLRASAGFFPALGMAPALGRTFTAEEDHPGHEFEVVLSHGLWKSRFGGDTGIVGRVVHLNGYPYTVIGVMPQDFIFPDRSGMPVSVNVPKRTQLWVPLALPPNPTTASGDLCVIGELKPNMGLAQAQEDLEVYNQRLLEKNPAAKGWSFRVVPLTRQTVSGTRRPLLLLFGAVCVVLLIACSNVAGLMLNRSLGRRKEFTLRGALGARRGRIVGQLMTESLLLAGAGGILGIVVAEASLLLVQRFGPDTIPHLQDAGLDLRVVAFALAITLITGVLFGLAPAFGATRMNMVEALKEGGQRSGGSISAPRIRNMLLISQVALAMVLVVAAGLLVRTFYHMMHASSGFDPTQVVTFEVPLPTSKYSDTDRMAQIYRQILLHLQSIGATQSTGFASVVPMGGASDNTGIRIPGRRVADRTDIPFANYIFISPGYFRTIGTPLENGRDIADTDTLASMPVAIINSTMAKKYWPGQDPIGKQVGVGLTIYPVRTIVGVVADAKQVSLREVPDPTMFVPYTQNEIRTWPDMQSMQYAIRVQGDPTSIAVSVREAAYAVDPDLPISNFATLDSLVDTSMAADRFAMLLLGAFGALALILAAIGMYGVISYSVMQRTAEIGVRIALGAHREQIFAMILLKGTRLVAAGIVIGLLVALLTTRLMTSFLYGVQPTDPVTFAAVSLLLMAVALLACYLPARKAMKVDPIIALRYE